MAIAKVLFPLPDCDFDVTEVASWKLLRETGHDVVFATERDQAARGRSGRTPGSAATIVLAVRQERAPAVRHEMPGPRRSQPAAW